MEHAQVISSGEESSQSDAESVPSSHTLDIDPWLRPLLREHQIAGVQFMYNCIMRHRGPFSGCILAVNSR